MEIATIATRGTNRTTLVRGLTAITILLGITFGAEPAVAQTRAPEYEVKAAYLFNFAKFIKWKTPAEGAFSICVLGANPFADALERTVRGERIDNREVVIRSVRTVAEVRGCNIVYVSSSERTRYRALLPQLSAGGALTVSDLANFTDHGGMIQFVMQENRVRFQVNLAAAEKAGLTLSSELLRVATTVKRESGD